jgi:formylglycine-generating enzyme required for sulfatase activity
VGAVIVAFAGWAWRRPVDHGVSRGPAPERPESEVHEALWTACAGEPVRALEARILEPRIVTGRRRSEERVGLRDTQAALRLDDLELDAPTPLGAEGAGTFRGRWAVTWAEPLADGTEEETGRFAVDLEWTLDRRGKVTVEVRDARYASNVFTALFDMVAVPAGRFTMGSAEGDERAHDDERPAHDHEVHAFGLAATPTTEHQWAMVMGDGRPADPKLPKVDVSWGEALEFCQRLSALAGYAPVYEGRGDNRKWKPDRLGFRLPTEAEWEYACRAGSTTAYSFGDDAAELTEHAWFGDNSGHKLQRVSTKRPNPFGLSDMHGLVWEWCFSGFERYPVTTHVHRPVGANRVLRGGSYIDVARNLRSAIRLRDPPGLRYRNFGFRCAGPSSPSSRILAP